MKRVVLKPLLVVLLIVSCFACVKKRDLSVNTVIAAIGTTPDGMHAFNSGSAKRTYIYSLTQKTLHCIDLKTLKQIPILIKEMPDTIGDLTTFEMELKEGVTWDDGEPLLGKDVVFTVKMVVCPLTNNAGIKGIYSSVFKDIWVDKENPRKIYYSIKDVHYSAKTVFEEIYIQQKKHWDPKNVTDAIPVNGIEKIEFSKEIKTWFESFNSSENTFEPKNLVGLGAYQVTEYVSKSHVTVVKKANHWTEGDTSVYNVAYPEKVIFKEISDKAAMKLALKSEKVDLVHELGMKSLSKLKRKDYFNENYFTDVKNRYVYYYMGLNMKPDLSKQKPFFTDQRVRRALAHLMPIDELMEIVFKGEAGRQVANVSEFNNGFNEKLKPIPFDIEKAKELLTAAGWVDSDGDHILDKEIKGEKVPFSFTLSYMSGGSMSKDVFLILKDKLKKVGIEVKSNPMDFGVFYQKASNHDFDAMLGGWSSGASYNDPIQLFGSENWANKGYNFCGFGDAASDSLITAANSTYDEEEHLRAYKAFQQRIYDDQPYIFLVSPKKGVVVHSRFEHAGSYMQNPGVLINALKLKEEYKLKQ